MVSLGLCVVAIHQTSMGSLAFNTFHCMMHALNSSNKERILGTKIITMHLGIEEDHISFSFIG